MQTVSRASLVAKSVKNLPATQETQVQSLGGEDPLEKEMATHSSILESMRVAGVGHSIKESKPPCKLLRTATGV